MSESFFLTPSEVSILMGMGVKCFRCYEILHRLVVNEF